MNSSSRRPPPRQVPPPDSTALQPSHARFIPKEELSGFSTWSPGPLLQPGSATGGAPVSGAGQARPTQPSPAPSSAVPSSPPPREPEPAPAIDVEALQHAARQAGYHDGYRDGLAALDSFKRSFAQQMSTQVTDLIRSMQRQIDQMDEAMAQSLMQAAVGLARQVVRSELSTRPELVAQVARDAVSTLSGTARMMTLHVHPDDLNLVREGIGQLNHKRDVVCTPDPGVSRGGCRLESDIGSVDAAIESRWAQALQRLGVDHPTWPLDPEHGHGA